jgi:DNA-cytosine methyltransferase
MNILSLFDGMSCGLQALKQAGVPVTNYFASEIDKYAIQIAAKNHPEIQHIGDVTKLVTNDGKLVVNGKEYKIDLVIGGSPCQGFSFAGKQLNFDDPRSKLFFEFVRLKNELQPKYFLLENVKMKREFEDIISDHMEVKPITINSCLVSAQNRTRLYWTNIPEVAQPEDKKILLKDIILSGLVDRDKSYCVEANYFKGTSPSIYFERHRRQAVFEYEKGNKILICRNQGRRLDPTGEFRQDNGGQMTRGYEVGLDGKSFTLTAANINDNLLLEDLKIRKLHPVEVERLQTLPDNYTEGVSNSQRYKMLGNGWTVSVIEHILRNIKNG